ncbi:MAG: hypothetical protein ACI9L9_001295, partial [Marivirga sp.]
FLAFFIVQNSKIFSKYAVFISPVNSSDRFTMSDEQGVSLISIGMHLYRMCNVKYLLTSRKV